MILSPDTHYPSRRTYVLKLSSDALPDAPAGRLENLVTGRRREFKSADELLAFIAADLGEFEPPEGP
jgi:hypothetical protein